MKLSKFLSREFLIALALTVVATVALFVERCSFTEWTVASGAFAGYWMGNMTIQKVKKARPGGE